MRDFCSFSIDLLCLDYALTNSVFRTNKDAVCIYMVQKIQPQQTEMISMGSSRPFKCQNKRLKCKKKSIWQNKKGIHFRWTYMYIYLGMLLCSHIFIWRWGMLTFVIEWQVTALIYITLQDFKTSFWNIWLLPAILQIFIYHFNPTGCIATV